MSYPKSPNYCKILAGVIVVVALYTTKYEIIGSTQILLGVLGFFLPSRLSLIEKSSFSDYFLYPSIAQYIKYITLSTKEKEKSNVRICFFFQWYTVK